MAIEDVLSIICCQQRLKEKIKDLLLFLREGPMTKEEILKHLGLNQKQWEYIVTKLRKIYLLDGKHTENGYVYYISYEGFSMYLKMLRDTIYNLVKRREPF
ncbi:MAG: hypothetical protein DRJ03_12440 [Chloroflexi bacterium]|nr:MAG: hypothetical protein DRJ03_12440 [Chloroflexota bacterium]